MFHAVLDPLTDDNAELCNEGLEWKSREEFVCIEDRMCGKAGLPPCLGAPPPSNYPLCTLPLFPLAFARPMAGVRARADDGYIFTCCTLIVLFLLVKYSPRDNQSIEKRGMVCSECVLQMASQATLTALMSGSVYALSLIHI